MSHDDDKLSTLLKGWEALDEVPGSFRSGVWSRIAARQEIRGQSFWRRAALLVEGLFAKPAYATTLAVIALGFSIGAAHVHASHVVAARQAEGASSYLASISPLARISADGQHPTR